MEANAPRRLPFVEMTPHSVTNLFLQVPQIFTLSDNAPAVGVIPRRHQPSRVLASLYLEGDLIHLPSRYVFQPGESNPSEPHGELRKAVVS